MPCLAYEQHLGGKVEVARVLIANGADINAITDSRNETALHCAVRAHRVPLVQFLMDQPGTNLLICRDDGKTTAEVALQ